MHFSSGKGDVKHDDVSITNEEASSSRLMLLLGFSGDAVERIMMKKVPC